MKPGVNLRSSFLVLMACAGLLALGLYFTGGTTAGQGPASWAAQPAAPLNPGPDLTIQSITLLTAPRRDGGVPVSFPTPGQPVYIEVVIKNVGTTDAVPATGNFATYLYMDLYRAPELGDPDLYWTSMFGLKAGVSYAWTYGTVSFSEGCHHDLWAWTDRNSDGTPEYMALYHEGWSWKDANDDGRPEAAYVYRAGFEWLDRNGNGNPEFARYGVDSFWWEDADSDGHPENAGHIRAYHVWIDRNDDGVRDN